MKYSLVAIVAAASAEAAMGFAPVAPASRSGVLALRAQDAQVSRRGVIATFGAGAVLGLPGAASAALKPCPADSKNCWSAEGPAKNVVPKWSFPAGMSQKDALAGLKEVLDAYPKDGQGGVDLGGWSIAEEKDGYVRYEFKSGLGNFAKFFNGNKPFVDDFELEVGDGFASIRSASRVGASDFSVNAKRINYIAASLKAKGWNAEGVKA